MGGMFTWPYTLVLDVADLVSQRVTRTYLIPYKEDLVRFDFEVDQVDELLLRS